MDHERGREASAGTVAQTQVAAPATAGKQALTDALADEPIQRKGAAAGDAGPPLSGGGAPLDPAVRAKLDRALGASFTAVRVQQSAYAQAIGALAFTRGTDIFFAPGHYDPHSPAGLELLGHELTHVVQQAQGRVAVTSEIGGAPANEDASLEAEADAAGAKVARGEVAHAGAPTDAAPAHGGPAQAKAVPDAHAPAFDGPHMLPADAERAVAGGPPIQKAPGKPKTFIRFQVVVDRPMTREELEQTADRQIFGRVLGGVWSNVKEAYTPADSPVTVGYEESMVLRERGSTTAAKGVDTDAGGKIAGADARSKAFDASPASDEKSALTAEVDRRYAKAVGSGDEIKRGQAGEAALWLSIRDEVLFEHEYIRDLPDKVKSIIRVGVKGKVLSPADYDELFRVAKKIGGLPPGAAADYASKGTGSTTSIADLEASIERYMAARAAEDAKVAERTGVQNQLLGLEKVYALYKRYRAASVHELNPIVAVGQRGAKELGKHVGVKIETASDLRTQLEEQLPHYGYATIDAFAAHIDHFTAQFEEKAAAIALDLLAKYAGKLYREEQRYTDPAVVKALHGKLGGVRQHHAAFQQASDIWSKEEANRTPPPAGAVPGTGRRGEKSAKQLAAEQAMLSERAAGEANVKELSKKYPIFAEDDLPVDKRLDKTALAQASESELAGVLQRHIANRQGVVKDAEETIAGKHELIYKMDKLMPAFYAQMDISPGSIHAQIIEDKMHDDAIVKIVKGIALAVVAIALTVVSLGTATPAVLAAGASIGAAGLSAYMAYDEYRQYTEQEALADAGFADDPSMIWLVLAVVGAGVDMAAAAKAVRALAPAAKALEAGGDMKDFAKAVKALQESKQLEAKAAEAAEKAAQARAAYKVAKGELSSALAKLYSFPGALLDPDVYFALVKMAAAKLREGGHSLAAFLDEIKAMRAARKLADLSPEELMKIKQAWEDAERLVKSAEEPVDLVSTAAKPKLIGRYQHGSQLEIISKDTKLHGGNTIKLDPGRTTTVAGTMGDTEAVAVRGRALPGATQSGENVGGINILRSPKWQQLMEKYQPLGDAGDTVGYWRSVTNEFWETANKPWLDEAMARGDNFRLVSDPTCKTALFVTEADEVTLVLDRGKPIPSIFNREIEYLKSKGYTILADGTAVKAK